MKSMPRKSRRGQSDPKVGPSLVVNLALPYQDLRIWTPARSGVILDTVYEPKDEAKFEYKWQWAYATASRMPG